ncbi:ATP-binding protein [Paenibacillus sp. 1P07SE]|uniref:HAMP domain-containing sensor histidine kinase n=1 Tax=Paenibacillus sp. 1P07SE TaxID=3132209 RepID=UPI0039A508C4
MKIRTMLMLSYVLVMLLPLLTLYLLYSMLTAYDRERDLLEYMDVMQTVSAMEPVLQDERHYKLQPPDNYEAIRQLSDDTTGIRLYRYDGILLYSTLDSPAISRLSKMNTRELYRQVNQVQKNLSTYTLKQPVVLGNGQLAGFYEVTIRRDEWLQGVQNRTALIVGPLAGFLVLLYALAVYLLHRKLNRPLLSLQKQMSAFADGRKVTHDAPARDEIGELTVRFHEMKDKIESAQQAIHAQQQEKETMLAALSHDLKTPLTVIRAYAEGLTGGKALSEQEKQEYKTILTDKLDYMKQLIDDLSIYASLQASSYRLERIEVEGEELFDMLLSGYEEPAARKGIRLTVEQRISGTYAVDVTQMIRIMDNLTGNAIRHTPKGGHLLIAAVSSEQPLPDGLWEPFRAEVEHWRKDTSLLIVQNEGDSIPEAMQMRVFEPFVQGEDSRAAGGSSGLGLSIAKLLIERHGGHIRLWSTTSYGTLIACRLPERKATNDEN